MTAWYAGRRHAERTEPNIYKIVSSTGSAGPWPRSCWPTHAAGAASTPMVAEQLEVDLGLPVAAIGPIYTRSHAPAAG